MSDPTQTTATAETDLSGRDLGDYRLLRRIGRGAMAEVYLAHQSSLGRQVAVKVLKQSLAADANYVKRFQNEAKAAAALVHANIVQIYEVGQIENTHFIAQEYVSGQNLRQLLDRHGPLDAPQAATIMRQAAAALHRAAKKKIVHRDIKPENIMVSAAGEVKVADFGLSRITGDGQVDLTQVGITMGTPLYMIPEQAEGGTLDPRSDLDSLGVTMYHMLAGRPPFEGETPLAVAVQHVRTPPPRLEDLRGDVPTGLCRIVHKLLEKDADKRFQDATELLSELRGLSIGDDDGKWPEADDDWQTAELIALADARVEATQQLDALMKSAARRKETPFAKRLPLILLAVAAAFAVGGVLAWTTREPNLLARQGNGSSPAAVRQADGEAQYWHAMGLATPAERTAGFQAVLSYHADDAQYANLARQQLARTYLKRDQFSEALQMYTQLSKHAGLDDRARAIGLAGRILCYDRMNQPQKAVPLIGEVLPLKEQLDQPVQEELDEIIERLASETP